MTWVCTDCGEPYGGDLQMPKVDWCHHCGGQRKFGTREEWTAVTDDAG